MNFARSNWGLKIRLPLFKRGAAMTGARATARSRAVWPLTGSYLLFWSSVCPIGASLGGFLRRSGN
jgi:hypothetical protein